MVDLTKAQRRLEEKKRELEDLSDLSADACPPMACQILRRAEKKTTALALAARRRAQPKPVDMVEERSADLEQARGPRRTRSMDRWLVPHLPGWLDPPLSETSGSIWRDGCRLRAPSISPNGQSHQPPTSHGGVVPASRD